MVEAGLRVKQAGISLCQYVLIGAGGEDMWLQHAQHTAAVLNRTDPDFIRVRTLVVAPGTPLDEMCERGEFQPASVMTLLREERELIASLDGIHSHFMSDHVSNLLPLTGELPDDKAGMLDIIDRTIESIESGGATPRRVIVRL
jgi:radical SAM superfamily enzyme